MKLFGAVNLAENQSKLADRPLMLHFSFKSLYLSVRMLAVTHSNRSDLVKAVAPAREYGVGFPYDLDPQIPTKRWLGIIHRQSE
jgi:sugar/nucleoside kinase (ribokinase family)